MSGIYLYFRNGLGENLINVFTLKKSYQALKKYTCSLLLFSQNMEKFHTGGLFKIKEGRWR